MTTSKSLRFLAVATVLAVGGELAIGADEAKAQVVVGPAYETVYVPARVKVKVRRRDLRNAVAAAPVVTTAVPTATSYVVASPRVVTETRYVSTTPVVPTQYVETVPVVERRYISRYAAPAAVVAPAPAYVPTSTVVTAPVVVGSPVVTYPY